MEEEEEDFSKSKITESLSKHTHTQNVSVSVSTKDQLSSSGLLSVNAKQTKALCVVTTDTKAVHNVLYLEMVYVVLGRAIRL